MPVMNVELLKLGLRIRASRKMLGLNQKDFSEECGLDRSYFGGVERGERNLTFSETERNKRWRCFREIRCNVGSDRRKRSARGQGFKWLATSIG
jgi:Helix-turn-helix